MSNLGPNYDNANNSRTKLVWKWLHICDVTWIPVKDCIPPGVLSNIISVLIFVMLACSRFLHNPDLGHCQPFSTAFSVTIILVVLVSYIFTSVGAYT